MSNSTMTLPWYSGRQRFKSFWWMCYYMCTSLPLVVCRCIQRNFLVLTFMSKWFLKSLWQRETGRFFFFLRNNNLNSWIFINKPARFLKVVSLISTFQRNENRFISLILKTKQQKTIQLPYIFIKFYLNQISSQFLLFLHFPGLWNL